MERKQKAAGSGICRQVAQESVAILAKLNPSVLASGHGLPLSGAEIAQELSIFSERFSAARADKRTRA